MKTLEIVLSVAVVVVLVVVIAYLYKRYRDSHPVHSASSTEDYHVIKKAGPKPALVLYYADWCPHCTNMMPEWEKACSKLGGDVDTYKFEHGKNPEECKNAGIEGFPSLLMYPMGYESSGKREGVKFSGPRTADAIEHFTRETIDEMAEKGQKYSAGADMPM